MKIAVATDDKTQIAEHFGGNAYILVATVMNGQITDREVREKPGHGQFAGDESHPQTDERGRHGYGAEAVKRHMTILDVFKDCKTLIVNRIGTGAYDHFTLSGIRAIATDIKNIDEAVALYIKGNLRHITSQVD